MKSSILSILLIFGLASISYQFSCQAPLFGSQTNLTNCSQFNSSLSASGSKAFLANLAWWNSASGPASNTYGALGNWTTTSTNTFTYISNYQATLTNLKTFSGCGGTWDTNPLTSCLVWSFYTNAWVQSNDTGSFSQDLEFTQPYATTDMKSTAGVTINGNFTNTTGNIHTWIEANLAWCSNSFYDNVSGSINYNQLGCCVYSVMYNYFHPFAASAVYSNQNQMNFSSGGFEGYQIWTNSSANTLFNGSYSQFIYNDVSTYQNNTGSSTLNCTQGFGASYSGGPSGGNYYNGSRV